MMRAEHVEAMERTEALMRDGGSKPGHNFGHSIVPPVVGFIAIAGLIGLVVLLQSIASDSIRFITACGVPLGFVLVLALVVFVRNRIVRGR